MKTKFEVGDVVALRSDSTRECKMTICQVGANFYYCLRANANGVSMVVDYDGEPIPFLPETLETTI